MPQRSWENESQGNIPIGVVFLVIGCIILAGVIGYLGLSLLIKPRAFVSAASQPISSPFQTGSGVESTIVKARPVTPTPDVLANAQDLPILLPESPSTGEELPSFAAAIDAPTHSAANIANKPVRLVIPSLNIDVGVRSVGLMPVVINDQRYFQWQVPRGYEVGWHNTSAALGQPGNTVLNGHNNIYGEIFRDLIEVEVGQQIILYDDERAYTYEVFHQELLPENGQPLAVRTENAKWVEATIDERITLVSCWPYATNAYRLVVVAKAIES